MVTKLFNSFEIQFFIVYCSPGIVLGSADFFLKANKRDHNLSIHFFVIFVSLYYCNYSLISSDFVLFLVILFTTK